MRRLAAMKYRLAGATYRVIAEKLTEERAQAYADEKGISFERAMTRIKHVSIKTVWEDVTAEMKDLRRHPAAAHARADDPQGPPRAARTAVGPHASEGPGRDAHRVGHARHPEHRPPHCGQRDQDRHLQCRAVAGAALLPTLQRPARLAHGLSRRAPPAGARRSSGVSRRRPSRRRPCPCGRRVQSNTLRPSDRPQPVSVRPGADRGRGSAPAPPTALSA